jgi:hypothetical protein
MDPISGRQALVLLDLTAFERELKRGRTLIASAGVARHPELRTARTVPEFAQREKVSTTELRRPSREVDS